MAFYGNANYLKGRPFLIINEYVTASPLAKTEKKGWQEDQGSRLVSEAPSIVDNVTHNILVKSSIVIDIINTKIIKNRRGVEENEDKTVNYFLEKYKDVIAAGMSRWMAKKIT